MSGVSSKSGTFGIAKQTAKGSPASTPTTKFYFSSAPSLAPTKDRGRLARTDASRDAGPGYTSAMGGGGDVEVHAHPDALGLLFGACLGANADSGTTPNFTHTITPANDGLWVTVWRMVGSSIFERYEDAKITSLRLVGTAGNPLVCQMSIVATKVTFLAADTALAAVTSSPYIYYEANTAIKFDTVDYRVASLNIGIDNNFSGFQADDIYLADIDPGSRDISLSAGLRFQGPTTFPDYRTFYYGSTTGTTQSAVVGGHAFQVTFTRTATTSLDITIPQVTWAAVPVQPDPGGDPIGIDLATQVEDPPGVTPIMTVVVKDQNTTIQ